MQGRAQAGAAVAAAAFPVGVSGGSDGLWRVGAVVVLSSIWLLYYGEG
jgi:hypothetical protein